MSLDGMSLKEARKLLDTVKEKLELVLSKNRDTLISGNHEKISNNSTIMNNQNGDTKKQDASDSQQQSKEDGKKKKEKKHLLIFYIGCQN